jgi:hypothetical protein
MPDENDSSEVCRDPKKPESAPSLFAQQNPLAKAAEDAAKPSINQTAELKEIAAGERWLIAVGVATVLVNIVIAFIYSAQLTEMRLATEQTKEAVQLARDSLESNSSEFDRGMRQTINQTVSQYVAAQASMKSANAAKDAASTAKDTLHVSERAYITTGSPTLNLDTKSASIPLINSGHIPSGTVEIVVHEATIPAVRGGVSSITPVIEQHWQQWNEVSIPPGPSLYAVNMPIPQIVTEQFNQGQQQVFLAGTLTYFDGFTNTPQQIWAFCYAALYFEALKRTNWTPCDPVLYIKELSAGDRYSQNETK